LAYIALPAKRLLRTKWNPWRQRADAFHPHRGVESEVDVLLIDSEPKALSQLASALTCRGLTVLCAVDAAEAFRAATRPHPRVVVMPNISTDPEAMREIELLCTSLDRCRRPFLIASYREGDCVNLALKDQSYMDPV
jgi:hypothetical protein